MSGYDQYGGSQYNNQGGYPPQQGYQQGYQQGGYPPQQGGYNQPPQQQYQEYPPQNNYGPPQQGGFQHGQYDHQYGAYNSSNPQGHPSYYGAPSPQPPQNDAYAQNQAYQSQMGSGGQYPGPQGAPQHQQQQYDFNDKNKFPPQSSHPDAPNYDPNAPPMTEGERGLLGAIGGGLGGHFLGKKANHGFLGTVGGAILGSLGEDMLKKKHHSHNSHSGSSWGGKY